MIRFKSLEVGAGDSFLIENNGENYLIDSGKSATIIKKIAPKIIDIAICTHNDSDHSNGFIGLLESDDHTIKEIWLPGIWATIIDFIQNNGFLEEEVFNVSEEILKKENDINLLINETNVEINAFTDKIKDLPNFCLYLNYRKYPYFYGNPTAYHLLLNLNKILKIAILAYRRNALIRWFYPSEVPGLERSNFLPLNSRNINYLKRVTNKSVLNFAKLLYLTSENIHSLVFQYSIDSLPRILFTADSIINKPIVYTNQIIVTAPHHGSKSNKSAYSNIKGEQIIWVRSDYRSTSRPCKDYLMLNEKYCLICTKVRASNKMEISFEFNNGFWNKLTGLRCYC